MIANRETEIIMQLSAEYQVFAGKLFRYGGNLPILQISAPKSSQAKLCDDEYQKKKKS